MKLERFALLPSRLLAPVLARLLVRLVACLVACSFSACLQEGEDVNTDNAPTRFTFLHTSDIHSRFLPYDFNAGAADVKLGLLNENAPFGGVARMAYLLKRERERSQRVLHLDSGDCYQGAPIYNFAKGEVETRWLSLIQPDAVVIGNHEFDDGVESYVNNLANWGDYTNLAANYIFPDPNNPNNNQLGRYASPFQIYNIDGVTVAVIGMANLSSLNSIGEGGNSLGITPLEQNQVLRHYVEFLNPIVDLVTVVSHLGLQEDEEAIRGYEQIVRTERIQPDWEVIEELSNGNSRVYIPGVPDVDIIFGGHLHIVLNPPKVVEDPNGRSTLIVHSGAFAKYIGRLDVMLENEFRLEEDDAGDLVEVKRGKKVVAHKYQSFPVDNRLASMEDWSTQRLLRPYMNGLGNSFDLQRVIGYAPRQINRRGTGESGDSPLGNLLADSMRTRRRVEAELTMTNTLGVRDNIYPGPITLETMFNVMPFENTITVMYLSGFDVQDLFDFATDRSTSRGCQPQAQVSGIRFTQNCYQSLENQKLGATFMNPAQNITINNEPLVLTNTYKLATNNYVAAGGSGFQTLRRNTQKFDTGISLRDAFIDYIQLLPTCAEYAQTNHICELNDFESQRLCGELQDYASLPCVEGNQDGRIQLQLVLGKDEGKAKDDIGKVDGDQGGR